MNLHYSIKKRVFALLVVYCGLAFPEKIRGENILLNKIGEIRSDNISNGRMLFSEISDFCFDDEENIYIADSGFCKIVKLGPDLKFIKSFGGEGQGPGEFIGKPWGLRISYGMRNIIVTDNSNSKLIFFDKDGSYIKQLPIPAYIYDKAIIDSKNNIYLVEKLGKNTIGCYDSNMNQIRTFLPRQDVFDFPYSKPKNRDFILVRNRKIPRALDGDAVIKMVTNEDHIIAVSNFSLKIYQYDNSFNKISVFRIDNKIFVDYIKTELKKAIKKGGFIRPFYACLDENNNIILFYMNISNKRYLLMKYRTDGHFVGSFQIPDRLLSTQRFAYNKKGYLHALIDADSIGIYKY